MSEDLPFTRKSDSSLNTLSLVERLWQLMKLVNIVAIYFYVSFTNRIACSHASLIYSFSCFVTVRQSTSETYLFDICGIRYQIECDNSCSVHQGFQ